MSDFIEDGLLEGEAVLHSSGIHRALYALPCVPLVAACLLLGVDVEMAAIMAFAGLVFLVLAWIWIEKTDVVLTDRRIIIRYGLFGILAYEQRLPKVESVTYTQAPLPRLLGFGTLTVKGTGGGSTLVPCVRDPAAFRDAFHRALGEAA